ncbi:MAG: bifunctional DNA-binding transcriptional regulator/O6-methylguanine-DNA methyltransferase Ada [Rubricoccaceae bacterium]|nr:bifunctional DNA-binding transcriptional regulator/O6-methylguanine-DNA methyltransferase Ada [Rubricoccaceae bacterium]
MPTLPLTDARWAAVRDRRPTAFVYAVQTTGIFCRTGCGARTPKRENVALFATADAAEAAGFRACHRCRPDAALDPSEAAVARARAFLDARLAEDPDVRVSLAELAAHVGWSRGHLQRQFTARVGLSPAAYADARRVEVAKAALREGETVLAATFEGGFGSGSALYDRADDAFGMTPGAWKRGGAGARVRYALFDTALGVSLVAATERGVCAVALGDAAETLEADLRADLFAADLQRDDAAVGPWAEPVLRALAGAPGDAAEALLALPLDVRGTAFQRQVWAALRQIPPGETRSYAEVAAALGRPTASRAVAQACGANRLALVVPCHRVVGSDGALRGYRWGAERKRRLLALEAT